MPGGVVGVTIEGRIVPAERLQLVVSGEALGLRWGLDLEREVPPLALDDQPAVDVEGVERQRRLQGPLSTSA
jgi:hypothetical protein